MANIFELSAAWKEIVNMADQLDEQTLDDTLEAIEGETAEKVANMIAVVKNINAEIDLAKEFKKSVEEKIKTMNNNVKRLNDYIQLGVQTAGQPKKGAEQFKKLEIKGAPWVKSAWTQYNPPSVNIVDERIIDGEYLVPQPPKVDSKKIAADWKKRQEEYEARRNAEIMSIQLAIDSGELDPVYADDRLEEWERDNRHNYEILGVEVKQTVGIRYR